MADPEHEARWMEYCNRHRCDSQSRGSVYDSKAGQCPCLRVLICAAPFTAKCFPLLAFGQERYERSCLSGLCLYAQWCICSRGRSGVHQSNGSIAILQGSAATSAARRSCAARKAASAAASEILTCPASVRHPHDGAICLYLRPISKL